MQSSKILTVLTMVATGLVAIYWIDLLQAWRPTSATMESKAVAIEEEDAELVALSDAARQNYNIRTQTFTAKGLVTLPKAAVITVGKQYFAYVYDGVHFRELSIQPVSISSGSVVFPYQNTADAEQFVVEGADYLRIVFLNNNSSAAGHSH